MATVRLRRLIRHHVRILRDAREAIAEQFLVTVACQASAARVHLHEAEWRLTTAEETTCLATDAGVRRRASLRREPAVLGLRHHGHVDILREGQVVSLDRVVVAAYNIFAGGLPVSRVEEVRVELEHLPKVLDRLLVILLLLRQLGLRVEQNRILVVRLDL